MLKNLQLELKKSYENKSQNYFEYLYEEKAILLRKY